MHMPMTRLVYRLIASIALLLVPFSLAQAQVAPASPAQEPSSAPSSAPAQIPYSAPMQSPPQAVPQAPMPTALPPSQPATQAAATDSVSLNDGYVLGAGDIIEVSVLGSAEPPARVQVQTDGSIQLPLLGSMQAADSTILDLRDKVRRSLRNGGFYTNPFVNINVVSYASRYVVVLGEVGSPGIVPIDRSYRVSEIMARVGGARASGADDITLTRASGEQFTLSIKDMATGGTDKDPVVNAGDKLFIPKAETFYIYGQVNAPGTYVIDGKMSLRMALARGGGLTSMGSEKRVKIYRGGEEIRKFNPSDTIKGGDVVVVGERFF